MALSSDEASRFADLLKGHSERAGRSAGPSEVAESLRGRLSHAELQRQSARAAARLLRPRWPAVRPTSTRHAAAELRALLSELSRGRARQGFTATETAVSVFALKDALLEIMDEADGRRPAAARLRRLLRPSSTGPRCSPSRATSGPARS